MISKSFALLLALSAWATPAHAWHIHQQLMPWVLDGASREIKATLAKPGEALCAPDLERAYASLPANAQLNPRFRPLPLSTVGCGKGSTLTGEEALRAVRTDGTGLVDEPDAGMDQELPDSADPADFRKWMGGRTGPNSQGFRHMYFGGWNWQHPLDTFQIPRAPIGLAPDRAQFFADAATEAWHRGQPEWAMRLAAWAMHYLQDLAQPYHSQQVPSFYMIPWHALYVWPPEQGWRDLIRESSRSIGNYHRAYEKYVHLRLTENDRSSPFSDCLAKAELLSTLRARPVKDIRELARQIAANARRWAPEVGELSLQLFGNSLKLSTIDIAHGKNEPDFLNSVVRVDQAQTRADLHEITCRSLADAVVGSRLLLEWVLK